MIDESITVLIPTSPIPSHPSTRIIDECIAGIRFYLPESRLIIMADGVRPAVEHRRWQYSEYVSALKGFAKNGCYGNAEVMDFGVPSQQAIMTREALKSVTTPLTLFVEHDAVLRTEPRMSVEVMVDLLLSGAVNVVRLYNWGDIWHEHEYLMRGVLATGEGYKLTKTVQYSQWPLFSTTAYSRMIIDRYFKPGQRAMIEPVMYGHVAESQWEEHKIVVYTDGLPGMTHLNGRMDEKTGYRDPAEW